MFTDCFPFEYQISLYVSVSLGSPCQLKNIRAIILQKHKIGLFPENAQK